MLGDFFTSSSGHPDRSDEKWVELGTENGDSGGLFKILPIFCPHQIFWGPFFSL
jgi:hypothetical protein